VRFTTTDRVVDAVRHLSLTIGRGETVAVVGESGSGKSVTALSVMRLVEHGGGRIVGGSIGFQRPRGGRVDLAQAAPATLRAIRGAEIAMIFQEPMTSLNPVFTVGDQIAESIRLHQGKDAAAARAEALAMLDQVRIPEARQVLTRFPHQLSGGMRQRVMIAMALSCRPALLIADEPTTALDVTIQAQILALIRILQDEMHMGVMFITHDMGVVAEVADRVVVMYRGEKVEEGPAQQVFTGWDYVERTDSAARIARISQSERSASSSRLKLSATAQPSSVRPPRATARRTCLTSGFLSLRRAPVMRVFVH